MAADKDRVWQTLEDIRFCMMVTDDGEALRARPMMSFPDKDEHAIWFVTDRRSAKDDEIETFDEVCLAYGDRNMNSWVSISGVGDIVEDGDKLRSLWTKEVDAWFPEGPDDPNAILLKITPFQAQLWDGPSDGREIEMEIREAQEENRRPDLGDNLKVSL